MSQDRIVENYWKIFNAIQNISTPEWLHLELSMAQLKTLFYLSFSGPVPISKLAESLEIGLPTASHLVEKLVQSGLAERIGDPDDRRYIRAGLTAAGVELSSRLREGRREQMNMWLEQLSDEDRTALAQGIEALMRIIQPK
jgi:DNA-binding MarR family transcriptional regulator